MHPHKHTNATPTMRHSNYAVRHRLVALFPVIFKMQAVANRSTANIHKHATKIPLPSYHRTPAHPGTNPLQPQPEHRRHLPQSILWARPAQQQCRLTTPAPTPSDESA